MSDGQPSGSALQIPWDKATVPLEGLERALYALADLVTGSVCDDQHQWRLVIYPRQAGCDLDALRHRVRQEVNDQSLRIKIAEQTAPLRNLIFAVAFSRSGVSRDGSSP